MTNRKRTQAKELLAKRYKSKKTVSHLLVCGLVLSSSVMPAVTVLAEGVEQPSTTQTAQTATQETTQESTQPTVESTTSESTQVEQIPTQESTQPTVESTISESTQVEQIPTQESTQRSTQATTPSETEKTPEVPVETTSAVDANSMLTEPIQNSIPIQSNTSTVQTNETQDSTNNLYIKGDTEMGLVTVRYYDDGGRYLASEKFIKGKIGEKFDEKPLDIDGYHISEKSVKEFKGEFTKSRQTARFIYEKDADTIEGVSVLIWYKDAEKGNFIDVSPGLIGKIGTEFTIVPPDVKGYTFNKEKSGNITGTFKAEDQLFILYYDKTSEQGTVTFKYVDKDSKELKAPKEVTGKIGDSYTETAPEIEGYTLDLDTTVTGKTATGKFTEQGQRIYFVYKKNQDKPDPEQEVIIDINFVDQDGDAVKESVQITGKTGDKYDLSKYAVEIDGYKLDKSKLPTLVGVLGDENTQVTFHYTAVSEPVDPNDNGSTDNNDNNNTNDSSTNTNATNTPSSSSNDKGTESKKEAIKPVSTKQNTNSSTNKKDTLPQTGESVSPWFTLAGLVALASTAFAWFFKRKKA